ncbi:MULTISPECIES: alpha/beta fold hydrolase [Frankia]|uniref:AB hydrolase-1 domain-containing protein n=2 Tax=Frankia TaxID=1854 RepID=Q0RHR0_FRAAA|nr:hypothetical protein FRAAL4322 [Frankia alni ACN14a]
MTSRQFTIRGGEARLRCDDTGRGPVLIFLNGAFGTRRDWRRVLDTIGGRYRCVTFDARGRGRSSQAPEYSFDDDLRDAARVVDAVGTGRLAGSRGSATGRPGYHR